MKRLLLSPLSWLFGLLVWLRNTGYDRGWLSVRRLDAPVISVGNLAMGGTGKSPVVADLVTRLSAEGCQVAILSRGYGRREPKRSRCVDLEQDWHLFGDEPVMLAHRCPQAWVCVGPSRYEAAQVLVPRNPDLYVIDDGFQHRALARDLDLVLLDVTQPLPERFPLALYRETASALRRADGVILTRCEPDRIVTEWEQLVRKANPRIPLLKLRFEPDSLVSLTGRRRSLKELKGRRIGAYCGIARPGNFFASLERLGAEVVEKMVLADHGEASPKQWQTFEKSCRIAGVEMVVTTEKDAVKLDKSQDFGIFLVFLNLGAVWEEKQALVDLLQSVRQRNAV